MSTGIWKEQPEGKKRLEDSHKREVMKTDVQEAVDLVDRAVGGGTV
jgi:hypothetical protein